MGTGHTDTTDTRGGRTSPKRETRTTPGRQRRPNDRRTRPPPLPMHRRSRSPLPLPEPSPCGGLASLALLSRPLAGPRLARKPPGPIASVPSAGGGGKCCVVIPNQAVGFRRNTAGPADGTPSPHSRGTAPCMTRQACRGLEEWRNFGPLRRGLIRHRASRQSSACHTGTR